MRLTVHTDYAVRVLVYLALHPGRTVPVGEISDAYGISHNHLNKVAARLAVLGLVDTVRGRYGGYRLAREPEQIGIGNLVRGSEDELAPAECFRPDNQCVITPACRLAGIFDAAQTAFLKRLDDYTLADLVVPARRLRALLSRETGRDTAA